MDVSGVISETPVGVHRRDRIDEITCRSIRVAYFAGTMRPDHDGVTRVLYTWIDGLKRAGIDHMFFTPIMPPDRTCTPAMVEVPSIAFPLYRDYRVAKPGYGYFVEQLRSFKPDILHINSPCTLGLSAVRFGRRFGIPVVATYHTHFAWMARYYGVQALAPLSWTYMRSLYNRCERVFVPSRPIMDDLLRHGLQTVEFLPHGIDTNAFNPRHRDPHWREVLGVGEKKVLLYVGRLAWEKDLRILVAAYRVLTTSREDTIFVLAGDGPARAELESLMPHAIFLGHLPGTALARAYASSDLFIFPSTVETFGNVTMEAMASGLPAVCARRGGALGIIKHGTTGFLTTPGDPGDLVRHIEYLLDHPEHRAVVSRAAIAFAEAQRWGPILDRMFSRYHDVIDRFWQKSVP